MSQTQREFPRSLSRWQRAARRLSVTRIPSGRQVRLHQRNIFILPSGHGLLFLGVAGLIFIAAINYAVSLAFGLAFFMVSLFLLSIFYTYKNLHRLQLTALATAPVFCGETIPFNISLSRSDSEPAEGLVFEFIGGFWAKAREGLSEPQTFANLVNSENLEIQVSVRATRRGETKAPLLRVSSVFPLGLARAWSVVDLPLACLVYPRPIPTPLPPAMADPGQSLGLRSKRAGAEEFEGFRDYQPGDPLRQLAWKNMAKGQGVLVKELSEPVSSSLWLNWELFYGLPVEEKLSRLSYLVLRLSQGSRPFGLKIPGVLIEPGIGPAHRSRLLRTLALFESAE